jgi:hypothetical protein
MFVGIYLALILSIIHFVSDIFIKFTKKHIQKLMSLSAGIILAILFLEILPSFAIGALETNYLLFIFPLLGFAAFHSIRAYNFKHIQTKKELKARFRKNHILAFFIEHFILGFALTLSFKNPVISILLFLPFILLTVSSSILLKIIDKTSRGDKTRMILGSAPVLGALAGTFFSFNQVLYLGALGYIMGSLFYIVSRDIIPVEEKKEDSVSFFIGLIATSILLLAKVII